MKSQIDDGRLQPIGRKISQLNEKSSGGGIAQVNVRQFFIFRFLNPRQWTRVTSAAALPLFVAAHMAVEKRESTTPFTLYTVRSPCEIKPAITILSFAIKYNPSVLLKHIQRRKKNKKSSRRRQNRWKKN